MIEITGVSKRYGRRRVLSDISMTVRPGEVTLLLGANGAGKSTLLRSVLGIIDFEGSIRINGLDPLRDGRAARAQTGYMPQTGGLHRDLTVGDTVRFHAALRHVSANRGAALLAEANLSGHERVRVGDLSGGMLQRLGFVLALVGDPDVLVLDEPSASLDAASRDWLSRRLRAVAAAGRTVLVSTHADHDLRAIADRHVVLEDGRIVASGAAVPDARPPIGGHAAPDAAVREAAWSGPAAAQPPARRHMPRPPVGPIIAKELLDAVRNRWVLGYALVTGVLGVAAAWTGIQSSAGLAVQTFGRTTATLMNLCLLLAPLVAVTVGAAAVAGERDRGTLDHLLAQPLTRTDLLIGKHAGLLMALVLATFAGFLPAGAIVAASAGGASLAHYLVFPAIASLLVAALLGVGLLISVSSPTAAQAQGTGLFAWFTFVLLYDLLLIGTLGLSGMSVELLAACLFANPVDAARVLGVLALEPDLYLLGPAGAWLATAFSRGGAAAALLGALFLWSLVPPLLAVVRFRLPRQRSSAQACRRVVTAVSGPVRMGRCSPADPATEEVTS